MNDKHSGFLATDISCIRGNRSVLEIEARYTWAAATRSSQRRRDPRVIDGEIKWKVDEEQTIGKGSYHSCLAALRIGTRLCREWS